MEKLKSVLVLIILVGILGLGGYWAVITLQSGSEFKTAEKMKALKDENNALKSQVADLSDQLASVQSATPPVTATTVVVDPTPTPAPLPKPAPKPTTTTTYKNQSLIDALSALSKKGITMKAKEADASVGNVQKFLNLYFKTSSKIDNDYGTTTQKAVASFQKDQGLKADGFAGPTTFDKMVAWLKKQG